MSYVVQIRMCSFVMFHIAYGALSPTLLHSGMAHSIRYTSVCIIISAVFSCLSWLPNAEEGDDGKTAEASTKPQRHGSIACEVLQRTDPREDGAISQRDAGRYQRHGKAQLVRTRTCRFALWGIKSVN